MDLREVTFRERTGDALLWTRRQALATGVDFVLTGVTTPRVAQVLRLTGTSSLSDLGLRSCRGSPGAAGHGGTIAVLPGQHSVAADLGMVVTSLRMSADLERSSALAGGHTSTRFLNRGLFTSGTGLVQDDAVQSGTDPFPTSVTQP